MNEGASAIRPAERIAFLAVLAIAAFLRLYRLGDTPTLYGDEFVHLELAKSLLSFEPQVGAFRVDWFGTIAHPPLFFALGALPLALFGESLTVLRAIPALAGTATVALLYATGSRLRDRAFGLVAAAAYAVTPFVVTLDRRAYSYQLVVPLALGALFFLLRHRERSEAHPLYWASLCISALLVTGYYAVPLAALFGLYVALNDRRRWLPVAAIVASLPALFAMVFLLPRWDAVAFTLAWELGRASELRFDLVGIAVRNVQLVARDPFFVLACAGLLFLRRPSAGWLVAGYLALSQYLLYRRPEIAFYVYPAGAFTGLFALPYALFFAGLGDLAGRAATRWGGVRPERLVAAIALALPLALAGLRLAEVGPAVLDARLETRVDGMNDVPEDRAATRAFLEANVREGELLFGSPAFGIGLPVRRSDLLQSHVYETGQGNAFFPDFLPARPDFRETFFAFDCSLDRVDWLVLSRIDWVNRLWRDFAQRLIGANALELRSELKRRHAAGEPLALTLRGRVWPVVHRAGDILVLRAPGGD